MSSPITTKLITDKILGSSSSRSNDQILLARSAHINRQPPSTLIVFTDGSAPNNPGPCGASAVVYTHGISMLPVVLQRPVSRHSSSYHAELSAVDLALEYSATLIETHVHFNTVALYTDCQSVIATLINGTPNGFHQLVGNIHTKIKDLSATGVDVEIMWVAGHAGLTANELADNAAKEAAKNASQSLTATTDPVSLSEVKSKIRANTVAAWQRAWNTQDQGRFTHQLFPTVHTSCSTFPVPRSLDIKLNRLRSGHTMLPAHADKMGLSPTNSPLCQCGRDTGTIEHFLLNCPLHTSAREALIHKIEVGYLQTDTPPHQRVLNISTLLGPNQDLSRGMRLRIHRATTDFLISCDTPL